MPIPFGMPDARSSTCRTARCLLAIAACCGGASAQTPPAERPGDTEVRVEPTIVRPLALPVVLPVVPGQPTPADAMPGLHGEDVAVPPARLLPEGTFLADQTGVLLRAKTGEWIFVSTTSPQGTDIPPLVLLPCAVLVEIERTLGGQIPEPGIPITLYGQVLVYRGRNYLLPSRFAFPDVERQPTQDGASSPAPDEDPRVQRLLEQLEAEARRTGQIEPPRRPSSEALGEALLHDGRLVIRQRVRVVRVAGGRLAVARDQDPDQDPEPPTVLLPSTTLTRIESAIARSGEDLEILISGRLYAHGTARYLLPISFSIAPPADLEPIQ